VKKKFCLGLTFLLFLVFLLIPKVNGKDEKIDEFVSQLQKSLASRDIPSYLNAFSPEIRDQEKELLSHYFDRLKMESVAFYKANRAVQTEQETKLYLQVLYQNSYSAVVEIWQLQLDMTPSGWQIKKKDITGNIGTLYRIKMPSERVERVDSIEIEHVDIKLVFQDALLFYDNIPGMETAILVLGKGRLFFSPSDPNEKHQLELIYKTRFLEDNLEYAFLRFSDTFFFSNIKINHGLGKKDVPLSPEKANRISALFSKHYPRSFTIENSLNGELLSFLPQGNETVFEFKGTRTGELTYIYYPFAREEVHLFDISRNRFLNLYSPRPEEGKKRFYITSGQKFDVKNYQIDLDFNPKESYLSAKAKIEFSSQVGLLEGLKFNLNSELEILRIYDQEGRTLFYTQDRLRKILYVYFITPPPLGESSFIEVFYRGKIALPHEAADVVSGPQFTETYITVPRKYESFLFSQAANWYPSPQGEENFLARLKIIVPPEFSCIANGELIEQTKLNGVQGVQEIAKMGNSVYVFETKYPIKYISFIVGKFAQLKEDRDPLPLQAYISTETRLQRRPVFEETKSILKFYEGLFGPFPYEKMTIVQRFWSTSGGHSPASFIVLNELPRQSNGGSYINVASPVDLSRWKEYFLAHEIAHQWWGQGVSWATYHDQWLSEGLAQFSAVLYLRMKHQERVFSNILKRFSEWTEKKSKWGPISLGSRLSYFDFEAYQAIVYNKASLVLNMLVDLLGEEVFFNGLKEFFNKYKYSKASTYDFLRVMEGVSGKDLKAFFKGWFDSYLLPEVKVSHTIEKRTDGYLLKLKISQLRDVFHFPLWVEWRENGKKIIQKVIIEEKNAEFAFSANGKPEKIKANPDKAVPGKFF